MSEWEPISEGELLNRIDQGVRRMRIEELRLWEAIKLPIQKWKQIPYGEQGGGFWVIGILGGTVLWYNDIEEGFNRSLFTAFGTIDDCWCNQDELEITVRSILDVINEGHDILRFPDD